MAATKKTAKKPAPKKAPARRRRSAASRKTALAALERDLAEIAKLDKGLADSVLAATARQLARELDKPKNSATSKAMCSKALMDALDRLRELAPAEKEKDGVDDLADRRAERRSAAAAG